MIYSFSAKTRAVGEGESLRATGQIPGVLYGPGFEPVVLSCDYNTFFKLYNEAGESSLIDLSIDGANPVKVLIQDLQFDPVKGLVIHVDFRQINMNKEMTATVDLHFVGEAMAVKSLGGTLLKAQDKLDIKCLPKDLVHEINIDISVLDTFEKAIHVRDLQLPAGITALEDLNQLVVKVTPPLSEEELKAQESAAAPAIDQIEVEKKGKEEPDSASAEATPGKVGGKEESKKE